MYVGGDGNHRVFGLIIVVVVVVVVVVVDVARFPI